MTKAILIKKVISLLKDKQLGKQLKYILFALLVLLLTPALLLYGVLDSFLPSYELDYTYDEKMSLFEEELEKYDLDKAKTDACAYIYVAFFSDYVEVEDICKDISSAVESEESAEKILEVLSEKYSFEYTDADCTILNEILGEKQWNH